MTTDLEIWTATVAADLEVRAPRRGRPSLRGRFPYNALATIADRGTTRKETFAPGAFRFTLDDEDREVHLLQGHSFDKPLARRGNGSLEFDDGPTALAFQAELPLEQNWPPYMQDTMGAIRNGLMDSLSPGFRVPPATVVPGAERLIPERGNPGVMIRQLNGRSTGRVLCLNPGGISHVHGRIGISYQRLQHTQTAVLAMTMLQLSDMLASSAVRDALRVPEAEADRVDSLVRAAWDVVEKYASAAPDTVRREAVIRTAAYLYDQPNAAEYQRFGNALRNSGAAGLLYQWRQHTAKTIRSE